MSAGRSHVRQDGRVKTPYASLAAAAHAAAARSEPGGIVYVAYRCAHCPAYHLGRPKRGPAPASDARALDGNGWIDLGSVTDYPPGGVSVVEDHRLFVVHHPSDGLLVLSWNDPRSGCRLIPAGEPEVGDLPPPAAVVSFVSPCTPARFDLAGHHVGAPEPSPEMDRHPVVVVGEHLLANVAGI